LAAFVERHEYELEFVHQDHDLSDHAVLVAAKTVHAMTVHVLKSPVEVMLLKKRRKTHPVDLSKLQQRHQDQKRVHQRRAPWLKEFR
jgi:hypothetical protein